MPEEGSEQQTPNWLTSLAEGGLPQLLAGPAGKALSRLVGAAIEVPASKIDGYAQGIKDRNAARSLVTKALAEKAAEIAVDDAKVMDRAISSFLSRELRTQQKAIVYLTNPR